MIHYKLWTYKNNIKTVIVEKKNNTPKTRGIMDIEWRKMQWIYNILGHRIEMFISIFPTYAISIYRNVMAQVKKKYFLRRNVDFL